MDTRRRGAPGRRSARLGPCAPAGSRGRPRPRRARDRAFGQHVRPSRCSSWRRRSRPPARRAAPERLRHGGTDPAADHGSRAVGPGRTDPSGRASGIPPGRVPAGLRSRRRRRRSRRTSEEGEAESNSSWSSEPLALFEVDRQLQGSQRDRRLPVIEEDTSDLALDHLDVPVVGVEILEVAGVIRSRVGDVGVLQPWQRPGWCGLRVW